MGRGKLKIATVAASLVAALVVAPAAGDASSSKRGTACPDGTVCVWTKKDFRGDREVIRKKGVTNLSRKLNNKVTSVKNRSQGNVFLMDARNGRTDDDYQCMFEPEYRDLGEEGFNDVISSVYRPRLGDPQPLC